MLKRKKVHPGMENKSWSKIQTDNGITIIIEHDPMFDEPRVSFEKRKATN